MSWLSDLRISCRPTIGEYPEHQSGNFVVFLNYPSENTNDEIRLLKYVLELVGPEFIRTQATTQNLNIFIYKVRMEIEKLFAQRYACEINNQLVFDGVPDEDNYTDRNYYQYGISRQFKEK